MRTAVVATVLALALGACGGGEDVAEQPTTLDPTDGLTRDRNCGDTMASAALAIRGEGAPEDVEPAIITCASLDEFATALADHPDAAEGDLEAILRERCEQSEDPEVTGSAICEELAAGAGG